MVDESLHELGDPRRLEPCRGRQVALGLEVDAAGRRGRRECGPARRVPSCRLAVRRTRRRYRSRPRGPRRDRRPRIGRRGRTGRSTTTCRRNERRRRPRGGSRFGGVLVDAAHRERHHAGTSVSEPATIRSRRSAGARHRPRPDASSWSFEAGVLGSRPRLRSRSLSMLRSSRSSVAPVEEGRAHHDADAEREEHGGDARRCGSGG